MTRMTRRTSAVVPPHSAHDISFWFEDNEGANMRLPQDTNTAGTSNNAAALEDYDPTMDPIIWSILNESPHNNDFLGNLDAPGPSHFGGETSGHGGTNQNTNVRQTSFGNPVQVSVWPVRPSPYTCSCCLTLREIIHTNGRQFAKLEIHGRIGLISHAVLDKYDNVISSQHEYQMFDFCRESIINVKKFLLQYCQDRQRDGYSMLNDPLSLFYDVLIVGLNFDHPHQPTTPINSDCPVSVNNESEPVQQSNEGARQPQTKSMLAAQRERTGNMTLNDIERYFHLPIEEAAKEMNVCPTVVKKICRRHGLARWPYRKIKSIHKKISDMRECLNTTDVRERARVQAEIQRMEQEIRDISSA